MEIHSCLISARRLNTICGLLLIQTHFEDRQVHRFSTGLRSGVLSGDRSKISSVMISESLYYPSCLETWCSAMLEKTHHQIAPGSLGELALGRTFWYHSLFVVGFLGRTVREPLDEKQPHTWMVSECFNSIQFYLCWYETGLTLAVRFSSLDVSNSRKGSSSEKITLHRSSAVQSLYFLMFIFERSGFFDALLDTRLLSKSLRLTMRETPQEDTVLALAGHSGTPWSFLHCNVSPLSLKFLMIW